MDEALSFEEINVPIVLTWLKKKKRFEPFSYQLFLNFKEKECVNDILELVSFFCEV